MQKLIITIALVLAYHSSRAEDVVPKKDTSIEVQKSKEAIIQLLKSQILVLNPEDHSIQINLKINETNSILEELKAEGLLSDQFVGHGPWCE